MTYSVGGFGRRKNFSGRRKRRMIWSGSVFFLKFIRFRPTVVQFAIYNDEVIHAVTEAELYNLECFSV
jgi:hypothetical protein